MPNRTTHHRDDVSLLSLRAGCLLLRKDSLETEIHSEEDRGDGDL